jgi:serine/threonine-protein kinase
VIGKVIAGRYLVLDLLGSGGMGHVYRATHLELDRPVAVKVLHEHVARSPGAAERFRREARALARLHHERCVQVHDAGNDGETLYIAMELIEGTPLDVVLFDEGPLAVSRAVKLCADALAALEQAHALSIVHRDLKPSNLFVERRGQPGEAVKVVDFGVALVPEPGPRMTAEGKVFGTPAYMAPEQCRGGNIDGRADLYAMGCALFELLTSAPPFPDGGYAEVMAAQLYQPPPRLRDFRRDAPAALEAALLKSLAKLPQERFQSAPAMREALLAALGEAPPEQRRGEGKKTARGAASEIVLTPARMQGAPPVGLVSGAGGEPSVATALGAAGLEVRAVSGGDLGGLGALVVVPAAGDDGVSLAQSLATAPGAPPVLLCGAEDDLDRMARAIQAGVYDYVPLPLDAADLVRKVARALRRRR